MVILYDLVFLLFTIAYLPLFLCRGKFHRGILPRFGFLPRELNLERPIWIHAVSVGEAIVIRGLIEGLKQAYPQKKIIISTVTPTGNKIVRGFAGENDFITYLPLDFSFIVSRVLDKVKPSLFIIAETEIWPNLISALYARHIPIVIVNGRISDHSFKGYSRIKFFLKPILDKISFFCVQTKLDSERLVFLGASLDKIEPTGNMKFDAAPSLFSRIEIKLGIQPEEELLVAGSTHPGEEEIILNVYKGLLKDYAGLRLLLAPRHPERAKDIEQAIIKYGLNPQRVSQLASEPVNRLNRHTVFILDTIGELLNYYAVADIVFVGGSLIKKGGHNILEPAALGKPIIFGKHMFNFRDITELFLKKQAAILAQNQQELEEKLKYLLDNPDKREDLGRKAKELISQNQGATQRNLDYIKSNTE